MFRRKGEAGLGATCLNTSARLGSGDNVISVTIRPTRAKKLTRTVSTGIRWRSPTPTGRRLDLPGPQLECRILGLSGLFRGPDPASRLHGSGELAGLVAPRCHLGVGTGLLAGILIYIYIYIYIYTVRELVKNPKA